MRKTILSSVASVLFPFAAHGAQTCYGGYGGYQRRSTSRIADGHIGSLPLAGAPGSHWRPDSATDRDEKLDIMTSPRVVELVVIDAGVLEHDVLHSHARPGIETVVLDQNQDALHQLTEVLSRYRNLHAVHLVSHGETDGLILGDHHIGKESITADSALTAALNKATRSGADLLLYACNLARDNADLLEIVRRTTHLDVAASNNPTGAAKLGGDWDLEIHSGSIETEVAFSSKALRDFTSILAPNGTKTFEEFNEEIEAINPVKDFSDFTAYIKSTQAEFIGHQESDLYISMYGYAGDSKFYIKSNPSGENFSVTQLVMRSSNTNQTSESVSIYGFSTTGSTTPIASKTNIDMPASNDASSVTVDLTSGISGSFANIAKLRITPAGGSAFNVRSITFAPAAGTVDNTPPTVVSVTRLTPSTQTIAAGPVTFRVTFSEAVQNVTAASFTLQNVNDGTVAGTIGTPTSDGDASVWDIPVTLTSGQGEFRLTVVSESL